MKHLSTLVPALMMLLLQSCLGKTVWLASIGIKEHFMPLVFIAEELQERGINCAVLSHENARGWVHPKSAIKFISLGEFPVEVEHSMAELYDSAMESLNFRNVFALLNNILIPSGLSLFSPLYNASLKRRKPHIMVIDGSSFGAMHFAEKLGIPFVLNSHSTFNRLESPLSGLPAWGSGYALDSMKDRALNVLYSKSMSFSLTTALFALNQARSSSGLPRHPDLHSVFANLPVLINIEPTMARSMELPPLWKLTGPLYSRKKRMNRLPASLREFVSRGCTRIPTGTHSWRFPTFLGVPDLIHDYSCGSGRVVVVHTKWLSASSINAAKRLLLGVSSLISLRILWLTTPEQTTAVQDILQPDDKRLLFHSSSSTYFHEVCAWPSVILAISDCGASVAQAALAHGVPLMCTPVLGDEPDIGRLVIESGSGVVLEHPFDSKLVQETVKLILGNYSHYSENARVFGHWMRISNGTSKAANEVELYLENGMEFFGSPDAVRDCSWCVLMLLQWSWRFFPSLPAGMFFVAVLVLIFGVCRICQNCGFLLQHSQIRRGK